LRSTCRSGVGMLRDVPTAAPDPPRNTVEPARADIRDRPATTPDHRAATGPRPRQPVRAPGWRSDLSGKAPMGNLPPLGRRALEQAAPPNEPYAAGRTCRVDPRRVRIEWPSRAPASPPRGRRGRRRLW
jgi:hypothetical protein